MPTLDVSDVILSPEFCSTVQVVRRAASVTAKGRSSVAETQFSAYGNVQPIGGDKLVRFDDAQRIDRAITFVTKARLQSAAEGLQPDQIIYDGTRYTVREVKPWTRYGAGFVKVVALSMRGADAPIS